MTTEDHHENCDVNDTNPEGIVKPCNCYERELAALRAERDAALAQVAKLEAWKIEIQGAIDRSGMGIMRTSQGVDGTMIGYRHEVEKAHFAKELEIINENCRLHAQVAVLRGALETVYAGGNGREVFPPCPDESADGIVFLAVQKALTSTAETL